MYQLHQACFKQLNAVKKVNLCHEAMVTGEISFAGQFSNPYATTLIATSAHLKTKEVSSTNLPEYPLP